MALSKQGKQDLRNGVNAILVWQSMKSRSNELFLIEDAAANVNDSAHVAEYRLEQWKIRDEMLHAKLVELAKKMGVGQL